MKVDTDTETMTGSSGGENMKQDGETFYFGYEHATPKTIGGFRQNHPELIVRDLKELLGLGDGGVEIVRNVLMARGVNKWFKVRRDLISYKHALKDEVKRVVSELSGNGLSGGERRLRKERLHAIEGVRAALRELCNTPRWQEWPVDRPISTGLRVMTRTWKSGG